MSHREPIIEWFDAFDSLPRPMPTPIHVRIVSTYPADFGLPEETTDVTMQLRPGFASTP